MSPSSMRYATLMEPAQFLIIKSEALTKSLGCGLGTKGLENWEDSLKSHEKKTGGEMSRLVVMNHGHNHDFYAS